MTLIGQSIAMAVFVWFCMKYVWPVIMGAIEQRQNGDRERLGGRGEGPVQLSSERRRRPTRSSRRRANRRAASSIRRTTRASGIVEQAKADGETARKRQVEARRAEIGVELNRAREELRGQVAKIAIAGAEKVLGARDRRQRAPRLARPLGRRAVARE